MAKRLIGCLDLIMDGKVSSCGLAVGINGTEAAGGGWYPFIDGVGGCWYPCIDGVGGCGYPYMDGVGGGWVAEP